MAIDQKYLDQLTRERGWANRTKRPITTDDHHINIHVLDRPSSERSTKKFSENQLRHAAVDPRGHRDPEQSGDPDLIRVDLSPMEKLFAEIRDTGRSYARYHGAHIAGTYGVLAGVWAGIDESEFLGWQKMAKTQTAKAGEVRLGMLMQDHGDDRMRYTIHVYYPVPKLGTKFHRDRLVIDWRGGNAKTARLVPVGGIGRETAALRTMLTELRGAVDGDYADFRRAQKMEIKAAKAARAHDWLSRRRDDRGEATAYQSSILVGVGVVAAALWMALGGHL